MVNFKIVRWAVFGTFIFLSLIALAIGAHLGSIWVFSDLAIASAVLTWIAIAVVLIVEAVRVGAFTSWPAVELGWMGLLWVLWLAAAADSASVASVFSGCGSSYTDYLDGITYHIGGYCNFQGEFDAFVAFCWLCWILSFGYWVTLLVWCIKANNAGDPQVWMASTGTYDWANPGSGKSIPMNNYDGNNPQQPYQQPAGTPYQQPPMQQQYTGPQQPPMQQQYTGPQQQYPVQQQPTGGAIPV